MRRCIRCRGPARPSRIRRWPSRSKSRPSTRATSIVSTRKSRGTSPWNRRSSRPTSITGTCAGSPPKCSRSSICTNRKPSARPRASPASRRRRSRSCSCTSRAARPAARKPCPHDDGRGNTDARHRSRVGHCGTRTFVERGAACATHGVSRAARQVEQDLQPDGDGGPAAARRTRLVVRRFQRSLTRGAPRSGPRCGAASRRHATPTSTMTRIIAGANQKGGVGKTTTAVNLAASLVAMKRRVLLVDLDPQGNATTGSGLDKRGFDSTVYQVLLGERRIADVRVASHTGGLDLVPANRELAGAEIELVDLPERETRLKDALAEALSQMKAAISEIAPDYDFILLDCPPSLSLLTLNGLCAADSVLIPMQCEYYALEGLSDLVQTIRKVRAHLNPRLEVEGLLRTMYDPRNTLALNVSADLQKHFGEKVYRTVIPRNIRLAEAPSFGIPALRLDKTSKGAQAYLALAGEMLRRDEAVATRAQGTIHG